MYYIKENKDIFEKYKVSFNEEEIIKLKREIIDNCSEITHFDYQTLMQPYPDSKNSEIRNYSREKVGYIDDFYGDFTLYHFIYDEYRYPYLVILIDKLLSLDSTCLKEIYNPQLEKEKFSINEEIDKVSSELDSVAPSKKKRKLEELNRLLNKAKLNENQKSPYEYYLRLQSLINLELVDSISKADVLRVNKFFSNDEVSKKLMLKI